jgi:hypothetical protein
MRQSGPEIDLRGALEIRERFLAKTTTTAIRRVSASPKRGPQGHDRREAHLSCSTEASP